MYPLFYNPSISNYFYYNPKLISTNLLHNSSLLILLLLFIIFIKQAYLAILDIVLFYSFFSLLACL